MTLKNRKKGNGNIKAQRKRRRERRKNLPPRRKVPYELIDGNFSYYPVAYCKCHDGYLTQGLIDTHRCEKRQCSGFERMMIDEK